MGMKILTKIYLFTVKEKRTRGHGITLAKKQCRLEIILFSHKEQQMNGTDYMSVGVGASSVNIYI